MALSDFKTKDPYAALRYPEFRAFITTQFFFTIAVLIQEVAISYYLYEITGDPLSLGLVGLFEAIPYISLALFGGHLADNYDKRTIAQWCFIVVSICTVLLIFATDNGHEWSLSTENQPLAIYISVFLFGAARGFYNPAWSSLKPFLVRSEHYSNSASWSTQVWQTGVIVGPGMAGFLYAYLGLQATLYVVLGLLLFVLFLSNFIKKRKIEPQKVTDFWGSLKEGFVFVSSNKIMLYSIILDMFSVLFGGVIAILPVFAKDILHVGPEGLGFLRAAPSVGAVVSMLATAYFPPVRHAWRNMLLAVTGFGIATLFFSLSTNFYLSLVALTFTGIFDGVSVVIRSTILQILPPDHLRGRVSSVNGIFVSCSNELGALESGVAAKLFGTVNSVFFGGIATLGVVGYIYLKSKELFEVKLGE